MSEKGPPLPKIRIETHYKIKDYDCLVIVNAPSSTSSLRSEALNFFLNEAFEFDPGLKSEVALLSFPDFPAKRLVHVPIDDSLKDYQDARQYKEAAHKGIQRALKAGCRKPLLYLNSDTEYESRELVTLLGALEALYAPLQLREFDPMKENPVNYLGVYSDNPTKIKTVVELALQLESGVRVARDIGDADPERMSPPNVERYIYKLFENTNIKIESITDPEKLAKDYPLFAAVDRAASGVDRHQGRIVFLEYTPRDPFQIKNTYFFVGKGVTYDTGGIDVKINGAMVGMSRDKCGAAAVVGFMQVVNLLQPQNVKVVVGVPLVRNSIGSNGYVADEVIVARSGRRVRVVNTDAEGRMIMADVLCKLKEVALEAAKPHLFTVATLTGHAFLTVGEGYSIVMDNAAARDAGNAGKLQDAGDRVADVFEVSRIRPEDFHAHRGDCVGDDVKQGNNQPSTRTARGHQGPAAFLMLASGLDNENLKYSHIDIAASAGEYPKPATGAPVLALAQAYLL